MATAAQSQSDRNAWATTGEFKVNTSETLTGPRQPAVSANGEGGFVVAWTGGGSYFDGIRLRKFDDSGNPVGEDFEVPVTGHMTRNPSIAHDAAGNFLVTWDSYNQDGFFDGVYAQRFDREGNPLGQETQINRFTFHHQRFPQVAPAGQDEYLVVWQSYDQDSSDDGIFVRPISVGAVPAEQRVNSFVDGSQSHPAVAPANATTFLVVWQSEAQDGDGEGVVGRRVASNGEPVGAEFAINSHTESDQGRPAIASLGSGGHVVTWQSRDQDGAGLGVFARLLDESGTPLAGEFQVNAYTTGDQYAPAVASDPRGGFAVVWQSRADQDGDDLGVYARFYSDAGLPLTEELQINSYATGRQQAPSVRVRAPGRYVVSWDGLGPGAENGVFARLLSPPLFTDGFESASTSAWSGSSP